MLTKSSDNTRRIKMKLFANIFVKTMLPIFLVAFSLSGTYSNFMTSSYVKVNACTVGKTISDLSAPSLLSCCNFCAHTKGCEAVTYLGMETRRCLLHAVQLVDGGCKNTSEHFNKVSTVHVKSLKMVLY